MTNKKVGVVIMRGQIIHDQHIAHIKRAALENDEVCVILGSINARISKRNPFNMGQRCSMLRRNFSNDTELHDKLIYTAGINNHPNNYIWRDSVISTVLAIHGDDIDVTLYGSNKDATTFYLELFPEWKLNLAEISVHVDATELRELYYKAHQTVHYLRDHPRVPRGTIEAMMEFRYHPELQDEYDYYESEAKKFANYPYPSCLNICCGDAVVLVHGEVLMVVRGKIPGKGCFALPGGHKESNETYIDAAIRELIEEAKINVSKEDLYKRIVGSLVFDEPSRSEGHLTRNTVGVLIDLSDMFEGNTKPEVYANDDAAEVDWHKAGDITTMHNVYDDHAKIVYELVTTFTDYAIE